MRLIVHASTDAECPENLRFIGHFYKPGRGFQFVRFTGATRQAVEDASETFLVEEREKQIKAEAKKERMRERMRTRKPSQSNHDNEESSNG